MKAILAILSIVLVSCSASGDADDAAEAAAQAGAARDSSVFDPLTSTLGRAESVESTLSESAADRRRQLEEAEGR